MIIVDIDGTIADISHRLPYIVNPDGTQKSASEKDWEGFYKFLLYDRPRKDIIDLLRKVADIGPRLGKNIIFITGRSEKYRKETEAWIKENGFWFYPLFMRPEGDYTQDDILKKEILEREIKDNKKLITHVFEDRPRCLRMYREELPEAIIIDCGNFNHFKDER